MADEMQILITKRDEATWVPLKEALGIVNMEKTALYYYVDEPGGVRSRKGSNNRDKQYNVADLKMLKARREGMEIIYQKAEETETALKWLVPADLPALLRLDYDMYAEYLIGDNKLYTSWITKNTHIALCTFDKQNPERCLAYISALPLREQTILEILRGTKDELDIRADDILTYEEAGSYTLLINSVVAREERYLNRVLGGVFDFWVENAPERKIKRLYAQATSEEGKTLLRRFYFSELAIIKDDNTLEPVRNAYYLDLQYPVQSKLFKQFQEAVKEKEQHKP